MPKQKAGMEIGFRAAETEHVYPKRAKDYVRRLTPCQATNGGSCGRMRPGMTQRKSTSPFLIAVCASRQASHNWLIPIRPVETTEKDCCHQQHIRSEDAGFWAGAASSKPMRPAESGVEQTVIGGEAAVRHTVEKR